MRRLLSILLLVFLGLGPAISALPEALAAGWTGTDGESRLHACCRRNGRHHCAMGADDAQAANGQIVVRAHEVCPFAPQGMAATAPSVAAVLSPGANLALRVSGLSVLPAAVNFAVAASRRSQPKRGPPTLQVL